MFRQSSKCKLPGSALALILGLTSSGAGMAAETVATGLNNPRGLNFGPDGQLYVAESGVSGGANGTVNQSGSITRIDLKRHTQERFISGLPSLQFNGEAGGPTDVAFNGGEAFFTQGLGFGLNPASYAGLAALYRFNLSGSVWQVADIGAYEFANNPDGTLQDSNPYGVLALPGKQIIADAGANTLFERKANGKLSALTVLPRALFCVAPSVCPDPSHDPVPTTVTLGPDGAYYASELYPITDLNYPPHSTPVYRITRDGKETEVYASGFGAVVDIAFDRKGRLFVLEIFSGGFPPIGASPPFGGLWQINPDGSRCAIAGHGASESLFQPGGIAVGRDGALYVTDYATSNGSGVVVKLQPCGGSSEHEQED